MKLTKNTLSLANLDDSTIVAIATPAGLGAISIIRLSGEMAYNITLLLTHKDKLNPRYAHLCAIYDTDNHIIEEAIIIFFPKPHSYTTQDVCEIQCHGGIINARSIVQLCLNLGARMAKVGEFTKRAFLGGRIDLSQAQAIGQLIESQSVEANKILIRQLRGDLGIFIENIREKLLELLAFSEAQIDYSEEILEEYHSTMLSKISEIIAELSHTYTISITRQSIIEGYTLSIVGKPNVGKSSLLNALLGTKRAIVSNIAGTTRDTIEECININGNIVRLIDTAGIRQSNNEIECVGIERAKEAISRSNIILAMFDGSHALDAEDLMLLRMLKNIDKNIYLLIIVNKNDLPQKYDSTQLCEMLNHHLQESPLTISLKCDDVKCLAIEQILHLLDNIISRHSKPNNAILLTSSYQLQSVETALEALNKAQSLLKAQSLELFSYEILSALNALGHITHEYENEEMLEKMFANFCLGK